MGSPYVRCAILYGGGAANGTRMCMQNAGAKPLRTSRAQHMRRPTPSTRNAAESSLARSRRNIKIQRGQKRHATTPDQCTRARPQVPPSFAHRCGRHDSRPPPPNSPLGSMDRRRFGSACDVATHVIPRMCAGTTMTVAQRARETKSPGSRGGGKHSALDDSATQPPHRCGIQLPRNRGADALDAGAVQPRPQCALAKLRTDAR